MHEIYKTDFRRDYFHRVYAHSCLSFAVSIGFATFIENDFGSETAWALVYGARWFEILWILLAINLVGNIIKYKMWQPKKLPAFIFHVSFLIIFLGAALTRYTGYEGDFAYKGKFRE
ncbi:MAG: hypothetical protein Q9M89_09125 [Persephonella sp.]|nr:hypothetical protein [Persephonella sp.]